MGLAGRGVCAVCGILPALPSPLSCPTDFFDQVPEPSGEQAAIAADELIYDGDAGWIRATGNVGMSYAGYQTLSDELFFNQRTGGLQLTGNVLSRPRTATKFRLTIWRLTGDLKQAVLRSLVLFTTKGEMITADTLDYPGEFPDRPDRREPMRPAASVSMQRAGRSAGACAPRPSCTTRKSSSSIWKNRCSKFSARRSRGCPFCGCPTPPRRTARDSGRRATSMPTMSGI